MYVLLKNWETCCSIMKCQNDAHVLKCTYLLAHRTDSVLLCANIDFDAQITFSPSPQVAWISSALDKPRGFQ